MKTWNLREGSGVVFLDFQISISNNHLETTVYSKLVNGHFYLEAFSCHKETSKWHKKLLE